ncbi:monofunctional biosynthetic peptidoglycan transglycosylase [Aquincola sp. S2]|uniref:Biosynthetic peptidoglycan transglycosylase n=1 Tax=Pseudaquabacterium terrae TaxID=2732868 RepID=A0ABX2EDS3_9BURK|nr:monofunctional biosynthetic peptidoglycan transglycosylase [Aquabacterium terrae]NRF66730.1 monofunctional biosynthetic peptidoglycan transglycosylase [Aquabacterium terrae]
MQLKSPALRALLRPLALLLLCAVALQLYFVLRIALMTLIAPQSTTFQRSEVWRLLVEKQRIEWSQQWVDDERLSANLKRAVIASEDAGFAEHSGIEWDAIEKAWDKNVRNETRAQRIAAAAPQSKAARRPPKVIGGSTISQQLAKNLFLSGERTLARKTQELVLTFALETLLTKRRILEIYLNSVEWGEGLFGAHAAARHYFRTDPSRLDTYAAARLAVMLPAPKRFEKNPGSGYVQGRAATIVARMPAVELP